MLHRILESFAVHNYRTESDMEPSDIESDAEVFFKLFFPFFRILQRQETNVAFSPIFFISKLCLLFEFTNGEANDELHSLFEQCAVNDICKLNASVSKSIKQMKTIVYNVCSSYFYVDLMYSLASESRFVSVCENIFGCTLGPVDFCSFPYAAARQVNEDAFYSTFGKVCSVIPAVEEHVRTLITDIHYFSCIQKLDFVENKYFLDIFRCESNNKVDYKKVPYFSGVGFVKLGLSDRLASLIVEIPLKYSDLALKIILPPNDKPISQFLEENEPRLICKAFLDSNWLLNKKVRLNLPQLDITTNISTKNLLQQFGLSALFNEKCDLSEVTVSSEAATGLFIDEMLQKVVVSLNDSRHSRHKLSQQCCELKEYATGNDDILQISRPFVFAITAGITVHQKNILLMGVVNDASKQ